MGLILGLQGDAKAGKDTVADYLLREYAWGEKLSFAGNLKRMCQGVFFLTDDQVDTQEGKEKPFPQPIVFTQRNLASILYWMSSTHASHPLLKGSRELVASLVGTELSTPRQVLQFVGTDICRALIPSYHRDIIAKTVEKNPETNYVITDVRFPNEGDLIVDELNGRVVQVLRTPPLKDNMDRSHKSETAMTDWGRFTDVIDNQKDGLHFLYEEVNDLLERQNLCQETTTQSSKSPKEDSSLMVETDVPRDTGTTRITSSIIAVSE